MRLTLTLLLYITLTFDSSRLKLVSIPQGLAPTVPRSRAGCRSTPRPWNSCGISCGSRLGFVQPLLRGT